MIILSITYCLKLQLVIHTWVLIYPVMNFIIVNPNRDSPNGYPMVTPTELQPVTLAH